MKKLFISLLAVSAMVTSCNMDTPAPGMLDDATAISDAASAEYFRNGIYNSLRAITSGSYVYGTELAMDKFIGLSTNGNRGGMYANGEINSSNSDIVGVYGGCYGAIASTNYYIQHAAALLKGDALTEEEAVEVNRYLGEAHFARAYFYFYLLDHFCHNYDVATEDEAGLGLQIQLVYNPTGDTSYYPGRSSMKATVKVITDDLDEAYTALKAYEDAGNLANCEAGASYLSSYAVQALRARVALVVGDNKTAVKSAQDVIANTAYELVAKNDYINMWKDANVSELIFAPFVDPSEAAYVSSVCQGWNYWWSNPNQCDYIPTEETVYAYVNSQGRIDDVRFQAFFEYRDMNVQGGLTKGYAFTKWPGNPALAPSGTDMYRNMPKPFRLSEQYLILAEAAALRGDYKIANDAINALVEKRKLSGFTPVNLSGNDLVEYIRSERTKELVGEGFRMSDLRRWGIGFDRDQPYDLNPAIAESRSITCLNVKYAPNDYRYAWPIPYSEMQITPALAGQQNPGY